MRSGAVARPDRKLWHAHSHLKLSAGLLAGAVTLFAIGSFVLLHELLNKRRIGVYYGCDATLGIATLILTPLAAYALNKGMNRLTNHHAPGTDIEMEQYSAMTDGSVDSKPYYEIASHVFKKAAITASVLGLITSGIAVGDENYRIHKRLDNQVTELTAGLLVTGAVLIFTAATAAVLAVKQKIWEINHPRHHTATRTHYPDDSCWEKVMTRV